MKIYGLTNVRVVDASVIPLTTGVAIQSTVYAIAEKVRRLDPCILWPDLTGNLGRGYTPKRAGPGIGTGGVTCQDQSCFIGGYDNLYLILIWGWDEFETFNSCQGRLL
jgi:GMC oxidoreductase